jgi:glycosyltransferase involved in cell wall biosynthesis
MKILFVVNSADFFLSHRLRLAEEALARGYAVTVVCGSESGEARLRRPGLAVRAIPLSRSGIRPWGEWRTYSALVRAYREERPDLVHHVTIKPVIYGTRAARVTGVPAVVNAISGLGFVFIGGGRVARLRRVATAALYRVALVHPNMLLVFQNEDDQDEFLTRTGLPRSRARLVHGSGVDLDEFTAAPEPAGPITFVLCARMLRDKGVGEFAAAAARLRAEHPDWRFRLAGDVDPGNPATLDRATLAQWQRDGLEWLGHRDDVPALLAASHVAVLPSYREGLPKSLLEAAACGRPAVATDVPGCRDVVQGGRTGLLVPPQDVSALAAAMRRLGEDAALRMEMGRAARVRVEEHFGIEQVVRETFRLYDELKTGAIVR